MLRFAFNQCRDIGLTFLAYQSGQPEGLPTTPAELNNCYDHFCSLTPGVVYPIFSSVFQALTKLRFVGSRGTEVFYVRRLAVDHTVASRRPTSAFFCELCRVSCTSQGNLDDHLRGRVHQARERVRGLTENKEQNEKDKGGISINRWDFGVLHLGTVVSGRRSSRTLLACESLRRVTNLTLSDHQGVCVGLRTYCILAGRSYNITLTCHATTLGYIRDVLVFRFHGFNVYRYLTIHVDAPGSEIIAATSPYRRRRPVHYDIPSTIIPGVPLERPPPKDPLKQIPHYNIPEKLRADLNRGHPPQLAPLGADNYVKYFSTLLHVEEIQMQVDIRQYDDTRTLERQRDYYILKVPGLAENRPSVQKGDSVFIKVGATTEYEGVVHQVRLHEVLMRLDDKFNAAFQPKQLYPIRFSFKRIPLRRMHEAIHQSQPQPKQSGHHAILPPLLFPKDTLSPLESNSNVGAILKQAQVIAPINRNLNQQQMRAVAAIMLGSCRPAPYIVFGPPGTGKTMTIVEAMGQTYHIYRSKDKEIRILACAPSNNAADLIADRLLSRGVQKMDIYRFNAYYRKYDDDIPPAVMDISTYDPTSGTWETPPKAVMERRKIVVTTCINAGQLYALSFKPFTHIFVDEAGQAMEPECLVSLSALVAANTTVVLAGDPKQLGPVIRSKFAQMDGQGLGRSLLERIITTHPYRRDVMNYAAYGNYNVCLITKLVNNYRSHPEILVIPNELFYDNELIPMADVVRRTAMCNWDGLPTKGFPMVFHGIEGKDEQEGNSPSFFNISECMQVQAYVKMLRELRRPQIKATDIGIITPYRKQAEKISRHLQATHFPGITVGSVEQFQGQERLIIIISCVRSNNAYLEFDYKHNLGFLKNPKRFNVAITRPQALLIVVGNPRVLVEDPNWARLLWHCVDHGAYRGCDLPPRVPTDSMEHIIDVFDRLRVGEAEDTETMENEDVEWRPLQ